jgi:hypothetical protein
VEAYFADVSVRAISLRDDGIRTTHAQMLPPAKIIRNMKDACLSTAQYIVVDVAYKTNMKVTPVEISKITDGGTIVFFMKDKSTTATQCDSSRPFASSEFGSG